MIQGWYYLHVNGDLIFKHDVDGTAADIRESDLARGLWAFDSTDRECVWSLLVESLAAGARRERVIELANKWGCTDVDADIFAERIGVRFFRDQTEWCCVRDDFTNLQESKAGFAKTKLEAMAELAKDLGYAPSKMWGAHFKDLVTA